MKIKLHWNPYLERWIMKDILGRNIYEYPDCSNFHIMFPMCNKKTINIFEMPSAIKINEQEFPETKIQ